MGAATGCRLSINEEIIMAKKLTPAAIRKIYKSIARQIARLAVDKFRHLDSRVNMSSDSLMKITTQFKNAHNRLK